MNGVAGYRTVCDNVPIKISYPTAHKYMNEILGLKAIQRRRKPNYEYGEAHNVFPNLLNRDFTAERINEKWCTNFTYIEKKDRTFRYNCTIIDLHDKSVIASITDKNITAELAIRTLQKAIESQPGIDTSKLILHSDRGSQFTSKSFCEFCECYNIIRSMSCAGCPYDNAVMERYYGTMKNEWIYLHEYNDDLELYDSIDYFAYFCYNHQRKHSALGRRTPFEARYAL